EELREAIALAAADRVRAVVTERIPLEDANQALAALRSGRVVGRAVLHPNGVPREPAAAARPEGPRGSLRPLARESAGPPERASASAPPSRELEGELLAFVGRGVD